MANIRNLTRLILKKFYSATEVLIWIGYIALAAIVLIVFTDVSGRYFLNKPLPGAVELVELTMAILGGFAIMYTAVKGGHIAIDLLTTRFPKKIQRLIQIIDSLLGAIIWVFFAYRLFVYAISLERSSQVTSVLRISPVPFLLAIVVALSLTFLILLIEVFYHQRSEQKPELKE